MTDLIDPITNEAATDERKQEIIQQYLEEKFSKEEEFINTKYPESMLPSSESLKVLHLNADLRKTIGYDYIPYEAIKY